MRLENGGDKYMVVKNFNGMRLFSKLFNDVIDFQRALTVYVLS
jgi:hypothetical protein